MVWMLKDSGVIYADIWRRTFWAERTANTKVLSVGQELIGP